MIDPLRASLLHVVASLAGDDEWSSAQTKKGEKQNTQWSKDKSIYDYIFRAFYSTN